MNTTCANCKVNFTILPGDLDFYSQIAPKFAGKSFAIPLPTYCPDCRQQRRLAFRNERKLYHRTSDFSDQQILSVYSADKPHKVYEQDVWWGDAWDPLAYGKDFDSSRPFFDQFQELLLTVPLMNLSNAHSENSAYTHNASRNKDCYLTFCASLNEGCLYCYFIQECVDCVDCSYCRKIELCYECIDCHNCYGLLYSQNSRTCNNSQYLCNCTGCDHCVGGVNLRNKSYYWLNQQLSSAEYAANLERLSSDKLFQKETRDAFCELKQQLPHPWSQQQMCEDCTGDYLTESTRCNNCFDTNGSEDCAYSQGLVNCKSCQDVTYFGYPGELLYECNNIGYDAYNCLFSSYGYGCQNILYCYNAQFCKNCFGCVSMHHKEYCILNKQYSEDEYEVLCAQIIEQMQTTKAWGEFFPVKLSPFCYNETVALEYFPLTKDEALAQGFTWKESVEEPSGAARIIEGEDLDTPIAEISDEVLSAALRSTTSGRLFRIIKSELDFYRKLSLPLPRLHPDERYYNRWALRNPRKLWPRPCTKCGETVHTTFASKRPEQVFCETCYHAEVY
ncbi:hypothetical protein OAO01_08405 [Oligoflexia bacterium]|nr:hypothetical protein [Oligoflexia bacterium]